MYDTYLLITNETSAKNMNAIFPNTLSNLEKHLHLWLSHHRGPSHAPRWDKFIAEEKVTPWIAPASKTVTYNVFDDSLLGKLGRKCYFGTAQTNNAINASRWLCQRSLLVITTPVTKPQIMSWTTEASPYAFHVQPQLQNYSNRKSRR